MPYYIVRKRKDCSMHVKYSSLYGGQIMSISHETVLVIKANNSKSAAIHAMKRIDPVIGINREPTYTITKSSEKNLVIGRDHLYADIYIDAPTLSQNKRRRIIIL